MSISVEVVYALPDEQRVVTLDCEPPITVEQAIRQSGILEAYPEIRLEDDMVGVFGHRCALDHLLEDEDRVEIYRSLYMSPTEARKMRAASRKKRQNRA